MSLESKIADLQKELSLALQNVPGAVAGAIKGLTSIKEEAQTIEQEISQIDERVETLEEGHVYSTNEHVIGKWIDGSDLYEKTIEITSPAIGQRAYAHEITNYGMIVAHDIVGISSGRDITDTTMTGETITFFTLYGADATNVYIQVSTAISKIYANIKYIKASEPSRQPEEDENIEEQNDK